LKEDDAPAEVKCPKCGKKPPAWNEKKLECGSCGYVAPEHPEPKAESK